MSDKNNYYASKYSGTDIDRALGYYLSLENFGEENENGEKVIDFEAYYNKVLQLSQAILKIIYFLNTGTMSSAVSQELDDEVDALEKVLEQIKLGRVNGGDGTWLKDMDDTISTIKNSLKTINDILYEANGSNVIELLKDQVSTNSTNIAIIDEELYGNKKDKVGLIEKVNSLGTIDVSGLQGLQDFVSYVNFFKTVEVEAEKQQVFKTENFSIIGQNEEIENLLGLFKSVDENFGSFKTELLTLQGKIEALEGQDSATTLTYDMYNIASLLSNETSK